MSLLKEINSSWTLFLDRDGVLNIEKENDYIKSIDEFKFYPEIENNFYKLNNLFSLIVVVTNQRGIGKQLMTESDLHTIHSYINTTLAIKNGLIHKFYFAPDLSDDALNRKPNIGMGLQAKLDFPQIDFTKSIMIGNNLSDMEFGRNLGMKTIYLQTTKIIEEKHLLVDLFYNSLFDFIQDIAYLHK